MTINIDIYCKREPTVSDLVRSLNLEPASPLEGYKTYRWTSQAGGNRILIALKEDSEIVCAAYDKECIDENIAKARFAGIEIPEELVQKFTRDNRTNPGHLCTFAVEQGGSSIREPHIVKPSCSESEAYTIRADEELHEFVSKFPHLEDVDPWFKLPFGLVKFTQGVPTYEVGLEATVTASAETLRHMTGLAVYFAKSFDGVIYDTDNNKFGKPDSDELHKQGMGLFLAVAKDARSQGARVKPTDF